MRMILPCALLGIGRGGPGVCPWRRATAESVMKAAARTRACFTFSPFNVRIRGRTRLSGESLAVQHKQATPRLFRLGLVVDLRIGRTPAVRGAGIDFNFR